MFAKLDSAWKHAASDDYHWAQNSLVSPGYFRAMGISLLQGRDFTEQDLPSSTSVAIVSQTMAREYFPGQSAVGQRFQWGDRELFTVIGVAADVRISALDADPPPMIYQSMFQVESGASSRTAFELRTSSTRVYLLPYKNRFGRWIRICLCTTQPRCPT
jgi:hypothetical protein